MTLANEDRQLSTFEARIARQRDRLLSHPLYAQLGSLQAVQGFMAFHVFAVWDFMSLLKALQRSLTCVEVPWLPPADPRLSRFINEIVLAEESDEVEAGVYLSHFELYLRAMEEVGADTAPILDFTGRIRANVDSDVELGRWSRPPGVADFMRVTFQLAKGAPHEIAASFLFGREDVIPEMFAQVLKGVTPAAHHAYRSFRQYLERHIEVDGAAHGPAARRMLVALCGDSVEKWRQAEVAAVSAIEARIKLWDAIARALQQSRETAAA